MCRECAWIFRKIRHYFISTLLDSKRFPVVNEELQYLQFGLNLLSTLLLCMISYIVINNRPGNGGPKGKQP